MTQRLQLKTVSQILLFTFCFFPVIAFIYKYKYMPPHPDGISLLIFASLKMLVCHFLFFAMVLKYRKWSMLLLHLVYLVISGLWFYLLLWCGGNLPFFITNAFLLVLLLSDFAGLNSRKEIKFKSLIGILLFALTAVWLLSFPFVNSFRAFITLKKEEIKSISFYDHKIPIDFDTARPVLVTNNDLDLESFCSALKDTQPFNDRSTSNDSSYVVSITKTDAARIDFEIIKQRDMENQKHFVLIEFVPQSNFTKGLGFMPLARYKNSKLIKCFNRLELERWKAQIK
jgi:hypothetical protein